MLQLYIYQYYGCWHKSFGNTNWKRYREKSLSAERMIGPYSDSIHSGVEDQCSRGWVGPERISNDRQHTGTFYKYVSLFTSFCTITPSTFALQHASPLFVYSPPLCGSTPFSTFRLIIYLAMLFWSVTHCPVPWLPHPFFCGEFWLNPKTDMYGSVVLFIKSI